ncbi:MAG: hypothetical protein Q8S26_02030 [Azonexus sp.]|nr:hypothetical protein [Azonexus sp.]
MTEQQLEHTCSHCHYFKGQDASVGTCHRYPPVFAGESSPREIHHWRFPSVSPFAWCGEFLPARSGQISSIGVTI